MAPNFFKNRRVYLLATVAYMGSLLFGYDTGVMGSVLALNSFKKDFNLPTGSSGFASAKNACFLKCRFTPYGRVLLWRYCCSLLE